MESEPLSSGDEARSPLSSAFEHAIDDLSMDSLPDDPENAESEIGKIHQVLDQLSQQFDVAFVVQDGRELGYRLALNHRLDDLDYTSPHPIGVDIIIAVQRNSVSDEQAAEMRDHLTDVDGLEFKTTQELQTLRYNVSRVIESVYVDKFEVFSGDLDGQSRILGSLQQSADFIESWIIDKPRYDAEEIPARAYIEGHIQIWLAKSSRNFRKDYAHFIPELDALAFKAMDVLSSVSESLSVPRGHLIEVVHMYRDIFKVRLDADDLELELDQTKYDDFVMAVQEL